MALAQKVYYGIQGSFSITDPAIANTGLYKVKREGIGYDIILTGTPGSRQVLYEAPAGKITFLNPFIVDSSGAVDISEKIYVLYRV